MKNATFTNEVYQNDMHDNDLEFIPEKHQPYFEFEIDSKKCLIGLDKILECLVIAEKIGEIPELGLAFWQEALEKFGVNYFDYVIKSPQD